MSEESNLPALYEELERIAIEAEQWATVEASDSTALVHVGSTDPEKMRERMIETRREANERTKALRDAAEEVRGEIRAELDRQRGEMEARMRAAMEMLAPLQEQVKRMEEGIWTVNLYLGTSEQIVTLREGQPARKDTPITLRTSVLAMDEETAAFPVIDGEEDMQGIDYRSMDVFDQWIAQPEALQQVLPEERGIVVLRPRRTDYHYDDNPLVNDAKNEGNRVSYWLIRNGDRLYRMSTKFRVGDNLMPTSAEFTKLFQRRERDWNTHEEKVVDVLPGTPEWERAEKAQGNVQRHYMRVALILQGLIDRTEVLDPLPGAVNVMQQSAYDDGLVVVVNDTERTLTSSREPYYDWVRRLNRDLRPGMRIIGTFGGSEWAEDEHDRQWQPVGNARLSPASAARPPRDTLLTIEARRDFRGQKGLVIRYQRTEQVYDERLWVPSDDRPGWGHYGGYKTPKVRASAVILPTDVTIIPFDLVTEEEMQTYLDARTERHAYRDSFPLLNAAIKAKREEREAEAPFRDLLAKVLADDNEQDIDEVQPHIDGLVHRFKLGNKWHRALVSLSQEEEAKALRLIRAEYKRIVSSGADDSRDAHAVKVLREHDPEVMFVGRLSSGKYVAFAPIERAYPAAAANPNLWVREHTTTKTARTIKTREWITPGVRGNKMTTVFVTERYEGWDRLHGPADDLTDEEMGRTLARAQEKALSAFPESSEVLAVEHNAAKRWWTVYGAVEGRQYRKVSFGWERTDVGVVLRKGDVRTEKFDLSYGGNRGLGSGIDAAKRTVYMPWHYGQRNNLREKEGPQTPKSTVVYEADAETLASVAETVREAQAKADLRYEQGNLIHRALEAIERQQVAAKVEVAKAKFLAEYPDEKMWEEHRAERTKNLSADVKVTDGYHFKRHVPMGKGTGSYSIHEREDDLLSIDAALWALIEAGRFEWGGLTVENVYALIDQPFPEEYERIKHLAFPMPKSKPPEDDEDEDWDDE